MNSTTVLEQVPRSQKASGDLAQREADSADASFDSLMAQHAEVIPKVEWLSILPLETARENVRCLPMSVRIGKRIVDIVGAISLLILTSPIMLTAAILVKLTSPGPIIYSQTRVGLNLRTKKKRDRRGEHNLPVDAVDRRKPGRDRRELSNFGCPFTIYKFRSMRNDSERNGAQFAKKGDARVTAIGLFMRRTRIDELPQLWNILKGDMSLIGPRPERPEFMMELQKHIPNFIDRLGLKPGLTGIAQVVNGYDNEIEGFRRKVSYDLLYLQNCCLWNDIKILFRTIRVVITGDGAL